MFSRSHQLRVVLAAAVAILASLGLSAIAFADSIGGQFPH
jgi:hypothetical protein